MNKRHIIGILFVLLISCIVICKELSTINIATLIKDANLINIFYCVLIFVILAFSFLCESFILVILNYEQNSLIPPFWSFVRVSLVQSLFNAITPMSTGGQPAQIVALKQMGISVGKATSVLLMKFIIYQISVFGIYIFAFVTCFQSILAKFDGIAVFIFIGFILHISSIIFLLFILFAHNFTVKLTKKIGNFLFYLIKSKKLSNWQNNVLNQIDNFYVEGEKLRSNKMKLFCCFCLTLLQLLCFYSVPFFILLALNLNCSWLAVTKINVMNTLFMSIVPIPGAEGGAEFGFQKLFSTFIDSKSLLVLALFLWRFATYFLEIILGLIFWTMKPKKHY